MKIFILSNNYTEIGSIFMIPDTALNQIGRPAFLPDYALPAVGRAHLVIRINRLGKGISERFSSRYFSEITVGVHFTASQLLKELQELRAPWDLAVGFDGAASIGRFVPMGKFCNHHIEILAGKKSLCEYDTQEMLVKPNEIVAKLSRTYRLCQGDLIFLGSPMIFSTDIDTRITLSLDGSSLSSFMVK
ncbi:fumarylacetoacetate hydrolase family protein [Alloprevotella rava]|uniref:2-keto-4-pentenoate hydratase/2-oxohepta-3-ene-1,7-dioic acid hydratase in catechol pathway n=1 Tax=Alloprevotella rava TaxID=671218 RepID=A0A7W5XYI1_9BACT|nr:fumarylacetoacetate hydrolase family protein [Alloprevotella rava]MBB3703628.1 2-keto-4-pentenoate hydratase/2-oxohepta-3-ene-1,7-dioic acid hydratase in catechol pathway [Alloprevotella rava]